VGGNGCLSIICKIGVSVALLEDLCLWELFVMLYLSAKVQLLSVKVRTVYVICKTVYVHLSFLFFLWYWDLN
jgi:Kef-type K+ transport system membrane component KefB